MESTNRSIGRLGQGEGRAMWVLGGLVTYKVTAEQTGGAYSLFEGKIQPGEGTPPHIEHREDECFYVVEGEFEILVGEEVVRAGAGSLVYVPKGTVHAFENVGTTTGRILDLLTPGGLHERFFEEIGEEAVDKENPPVMDGPPDVEKVVATAARYGIEILPPPGA